MEEIKLNKKDMAAIVAAAYPEYTGKKFRLAFKSTFRMSDYWDGGSRTYVTAVKLEDGQLQMSTPDAVAQNPFNKQAHVTFDIPKNVALVEHIYFHGKDLGIRVVVHPETILLSMLLTEGLETVKESIKSQHGLGEYVQLNEDDWRENR